VVIIASLFVVRSAQRNRFESESSDYHFVPRETVQLAGDKTPRPADTVTLAAPAAPAALPVKQPLPPAPFAPGDPIAATVPIYRSFFGSFLQDEYVQRLAAWTGIPRLPEMLSVHLTRSLNWSMDLRRDLHRGDTCRVVFRTVSPEEKAARTDDPDEIEILAMDYRCPHSGRVINAYAFTAPSVHYAKFYGADGTMVEPLLEHGPLKEYTQITSLFGERRRWKRHEGVDFKTPVGTPVYAPFSGVVSRVNWHRRSNGRCVEICLDRQPYVVKFLHLEKVLVLPGQTVAAGTQIALSGNTGHSTAPHLHYQINAGSEGQAVNPFAFHETYRVRLAADELPAFRRVVEQYDALMNNARAVAETAGRMQTAARTAPPDSLQPMVH
jgi:hypothetical protein